MISRHYLKIMKKCMSPVGWLVGCLVFFPAKCFPPLYTGGNYLVAKKVRNCLKQVLKISS